MANSELIVSAGPADCRLSAAVRWVGKDLLVAIWGGEKPHIGAVAVAQSRPSLRDPEKISSTASVICLLGHKEDDLAKAASEQLSAALNTTVVVTVGIHWDDISSEKISKVQGVFDEILEQLREKLTILAEGGIGVTRQE